MFSSRLSGVTAVVASAPSLYDKYMSSAIAASSIAWFFREKCDGVTVLFEDMPDSLYVKMYELFEEALCRNLCRGVLQGGEEKRAMHRQGWATSPYTTEYAREGRVLADNPEGPLTA